MAEPVTVEDYAREYVDTMRSQPNGWGQHVHPVYGRSDNLLLRMYRLFGHDAVDAAIDDEFRSRWEPKHKESH